MIIHFSKSIKSLVKISNYNGLRLITSTSHQLLGAHFEPKNNSLMDLMMNQNTQSLKHNFHIHKVVTKKTNWICSSILKKYLVKRGFFIWEWDDLFLTIRLSCTTQTHLAFRWVMWQLFYHKQIVLFWPFHHFPCDFFITPKFIYVISIPISYI